MKDWMGNRKKHFAAYLFMLAVILTIYFAVPANQNHYGIWSMIPPVAMFVFILLTQKFLEGFIWGAFLAVIMKYKVGFLTVFVEKLLKNVANTDNLWLIFVVLLIGALISVMNKSGGTKVFGDWLVKKAKSPRSALVITWVLCLVFSFDDYFAAPAVSTSMKEVYKKYKIPKELSTAVIRTAVVPGANLWPIGWPVFITGLFVSNKFATKAAALGEYYKLLPFFVFPLVSIVVSLLIALWVVPRTKIIKEAMANFDPTKYDGEQTEEIVEETKKYKLGIFNFILPFLFYVGITLWVGDGLFGLIATLILTGILYVAQGIFSTDEFVNAVMDGFRDMLELAAIMGLSFVLGDAILEIGFTDFIVTAVQGNIPASFLPLAIFCIFAITEFLVTLNWTLWIIVMPIIIPLVAATGTNPYVAIGALLSAGVWGSVACLISDAGMLTASTAYMDKVQHWKSVFPYAVITLFITIVIYAILGFVM